MERLGKSDILCSASLTKDNSLIRIEELNATIEKLSESDFADIYEALIEMPESQVLYTAAGLLRNALDKTEISLMYYSSDSINQKEFMNYIPNLLFNLISRCINE